MASSASSPAGNGFSLITPRELLPWHRKLSANRSFPHEDLPPTRMWPRAKDFYRTVQSRRSSTMITPQTQWSVPTFVEVYLSPSHGSPEEQLACLVGAIRLCETRSAVASLERNAILMQFIFFIPPRGERAHQSGGGWVWIKKIVS